MPLIFCFNSHPRKTEQSQITKGQVDQIECTIGKVLLGEFLETNEQGKGQAASNGEQAPALLWTRAEESQIDQQGQNPIKDKMSHLIAKGKPIDKTDVMVKDTCISQNDDEDDE